MDYCGDRLCSWHAHLNNINMASVLHWNYRGFTKFPQDILETRCNVITDVYLKENSITSFPSDLWLFKCLKNLYLSGNDIKVLPKEIGLLVTLKCLDVSGNLLTSMPEEIAQLDNLKCLIVDDNSLTRLPLSLNKLKKLRYLSVCDNYLLWLPQRPVSNYYAAEFRFWRNRTLQHIPFSLWLHMLRDQQIKSQNIGCFGYPYFYKNDIRNKVKVVNNFVIPDTEIVLPEEYQVLEKCVTSLSPPSLTELCLRKCYKIVSDLTSDIINNNFGGFESERIPKLAEEVWKSTGKLTERNAINDMFENVLPTALKEELANGPTAVCEFYTCKSPMFRSAILDITSRSTTTIEGAMDILVTACFCSGRCCEKWRKANRISPFKWVQV